MRAAQARRAGAQTARAGSAGCWVCRALSAGARPVRAVGPVGYALGALSLF